MDQNFQSRKSVNSQVISFRPSLILKLAAMHHSVLDCAEALADNMKGPTSFMTDFTLVLQPSEVQQTVHHLLRPLGSLTG